MFTLTGTGALTVTATSTNTTLLPNANITGESSCTTAGSCTLTLTPVANQSGTSTVTVQVANTNGQSATGSFSFTASAPPGISGLASLTVAAGKSGNETFTLMGTGALTVTATSANTTLLPNANITGESSCTTAGSCTLTLTLAANQSGTSTVTVQVVDANGQSATGGFSFTVKSKSSALQIKIFGSGTVTSQPTGIDCTKDCSASFPVGTTVVLTAQPGANEKFADWGGCDSTSGSQCTITLNANRLVLPTFASSAPVQMQPNVKTLDAATLQAITNHSGNTYDFAAGTTAASSLTPGEVIVGHSGNIGVLARVVSVTTLSTGTIEVITSAARLSDVIASGTVTYSQPLQVSQIQTSKMRLTPGVRLVRGSSTSSCGTSRGSKFVLALDHAFPLSSASGSPTVNFNGCLSLTVTPDIAFSYGIFSGVKQLRVAFIAVADQQLSASVSAQPQENKKFLVGSFPFSAIPVSAFVWLTPTLDVYIGVTVTASGTVQTAVTMSESLTAGVQYLQGSGWGPVRGLNFSKPTWKTQFQAAASAVGYVLPQISVQIDDLAGPDLSAEGYLEADAWAETGSSSALGWSLYDGLDVNVGVDVAPFGWNLGQYSVQLYSKKTLLASGSTGTLQDTTPPSVPQKVTARAISSSKINVSWTASTDNTAVKDYQVYKNNSLWKTVTGAFVPDAGLAPSTKVCYSVEAVDVAGNVSAASNNACATTPSTTDNTPPTAPTGLTLTKVTSNSITLQWQAATDNVAVTGYKVERSGAPIASVTAATLSYVNTPLAANTKYCYTVSAFDAAGNVSAASAQACATTAGGGVIPVGFEPVALAITPDGTTLYVANEGENTVSVIAIGP